MTTLPINVYFNKCTIQRLMYCNKLNKEYNFNYSNKTTTLKKSWLSKIFLKERNEYFNS